MYQVDEVTCTGYGDCVEACPAGAITLVDGRAHIDQAACAECGSCAEACPQGAIVMADVASPDYAAIGHGTRIPAALPAVASVEVGSLTHRPEVEVLTAEARRSRLWPTVGGALVWAARELLPAVIAAWQASRADVSQSINLKADASHLTVRAYRRTGHRHRWGRV